MKGMKGRWLLAFLSFVLGAAFMIWLRNHGHESHCRIVHAHPLLSEFKENLGCPEGAKVLSAFFQEKDGLLVDACRMPTGEDCVDMLLPGESMEVPIVQP